MGGTINGHILLKWSRFQSTNKVKSYATQGGGAEKAKAISVVKLYLSYMKNRSCMKTASRVILYITKMGQFINVVEKNHQN